jgi:hypothetical protein
MTTPCGVRSSDATSQGLLVGVRRGHGLEYHALQEALAPLLGFLREGNARAGPTRLAPSRASLPRRPSVFRRPSSA